MSPGRGSLSRSGRVLGTNTLERLVGAILLGVLMGWALVRADQALDMDLPEVVRFEPTSAQSILSALLGGLITLAGFAFWVRSIVVQLISSQVSPRVMSAFLEDRFQENLLSFMVGAVVFTSVVLASIPGEDGENGPPLIALHAALLVSLVALGALLYAMRSGIRTMQVGELIRRITERALTLLEDAGRYRPRGPVPSREPNGAIPAPGTGWLGSVDYRGIEERLEAGTVASIDTEPGEFVTEGSRIGRVWGSGSSAEEVGEELSRFVAVGRTRDEVERFSGQVDWLVDIAERAISGSSVETATVHEVSAHLGWLLERSLAPVGSGEEPTGNLVLPGWAQHDEVVRDAFRRIRRNDHPSVLYSVVVELTNVLDRGGTEGEGTDRVREMAEETLDRFRAQGEDPHELESLVRIARERGLMASSE